MYHDGQCEAGWIPGVELAVQPDFGECYCSNRADPEELADARLSDIFNFINTVEGAIGPAHPRYGDTNASQ